MAEIVKKYQVWINVTYDPEFRSLPPIEAVLEAIRHIVLVGPVFVYVTKWVLLGEGGE